MPPFAGNHPCGFQRFSAIFLFGKFDVFYHNEFYEAVIVVAVFNQGNIESIGGLGRQIS